MVDFFDSPSSETTDPARRAAVIVPNDGSNIPPPKAIYVGSGGDIVMLGMNAPADAEGVVWKNVPAGSLIPFRPRRILSTGTTAANMLALY